VFGFRPESMFTFIPESRSTSFRNCIHLHPGFPFTFARNTQSQSENAVFSIARTRCRETLCSLFPICCRLPKRDVNPAVGKAGLVTRNALASANAFGASADDRGNSCVVWATLGEWAGTLKKGALVEVEGELRYREYQPKDSDRKVRAAEIHVISILTLDRAEKANPDEVAADDLSGEDEPF
jgi:hypothetical protein